MAKHIIKVSSYIENEAIIYCPMKNIFGFVVITFPMVCPHCGFRFEKREDIKFVLRESII